MAAAIRCCMALQTIRTERFPALRFWKVATGCSTGQAAKAGATTPGSYSSSIKMGTATSFYTASIIQPTADTPEAGCWREATEHCMGRPLLAGAGLEARCSKSTKTVRVFLFCRVSVLLGWENCWKAATERSTERFTGTGAQPLRGS